jgi:hypothetical protein
VSTGYTHFNKISGINGVAVGKRGSEINVIDSLGNVNPTTIVGNGVQALADNTAAAINWDTANVATLKTNAAVTLTCTGGKAGQTYVVQILSSGTTTRDVTFGSGFRTTAVLATGGTDARYFTVTFVKIGATMTEVSRTAAMA